MKDVTTPIKTKYWIDGPSVTTDLFSYLVAARKIENPDRFIAPHWPDDLQDPLLLPDMVKAVERIWHAIKAGEKIGIVGDYDMDGTPASVILYQFLSLVAAAPMVILPSREEGYGFAKGFVDRMKTHGVSLIITVDCGIRDIETVDYANDQGCDVIITDHHEPGPVLPPAVAVIDPKCSTSPTLFKDICGTAVAWKLTQALTLAAPSEFKAKIPEHWLAWSLDLVALATVSDMVPLIQENRLFAHYGLKVLKKGHRVGLRILCALLGVSLEELTYETLAYKVLPKCNASGRMESMDDVFTLLATNDKHEAEAVVERILTRATQSQLLLVTALTEAKEQIKDSEAPILVAASSSWHPGVTGLVAARLMDEFQRPAVVLAGAGNGIYRGSGRSTSLDLPGVLTKIQETVIRFGGHKQAAGVSLEEKQLPEFQRRIIEVCAAEPAHATAPSFTTDGTITPDVSNLESALKLEQLTPWGVGNPEPLWSLSGVRLQDLQWLKDGAHLRATIKGMRHELPVIFFSAQALKPYVEKNLDIFGTVAINRFKGRASPQFMLRGWALAE